MNWPEQLLEYVRAKLPAAESVSFAGFSAMPAGASNDTVGIDIEVTCDGATHRLPVVLRPQRRHGILAPYDVERQFRVMRALSTTPIPVPAVFWLEQCREVIGAPFYFMSRVPGETLPLLWYGGRSARLDAVATAMAALHSIDWRAAGLDFLVPVGDEGLTPVQVDLAGWRLRAEHMAMSNNPRLIRLGEFLRANEPPDTRAAFIHGDPNPGNYLVRGDEVVAILDWELAAIGDPRADLGFYAALLTIFGGYPGPGGRTVLSDAYEGVTGRPLNHLDYFEAVGLYKMSVITSGWGGMLGAGYGLDSISRRMNELFGPDWTR